MKRSKREKSERVWRKTENKRKRKGNRARDRFIDRLIYEAIKRRKEEMNLEMQKKIANDLLGRWGWKS